MAHNKGLSLSNSRGREMYVGSEIRDSISLLDVLYSNAFEEEDIDSVVAKKTEVDFYRGAPPQWLNFCWAERATSTAKTSPFIKRDGYTELIKNIKKQCKGDLTSTMNLLHQPGSGGTTLAKQVLWDMRKTLRCAVLTGPTSDITAIANQVIHLFTAGGQGQQNTVLLLLEDERILENLQDAIMKEIAKRNITTHRPVVIILNCVRKAVIKQEDHNNSRNVILRTELSEAEKQQFEEKQIEISRSYSNEHKQFHGFNIMRKNFCGDYVKETCTLLGGVRKNRRPKNSQLLAFLSLVNAYVPGSHLLQSQCQAFLGPPDPIYGGPSFEQRMEPFTHLIVTFPARQGQDKHVRMAHPLIAEQCVKVLAMAGVTRSDTARNFLTEFCREEVQQFLVQDMLTKREMGEERKDTFSRLIQDIEGEESKSNGVSVLQLASETFKQNPFFPQNLARFFYIETRAYFKAEKWAKIAKDRDPKSSFVADTLGQVYKNHLKSRIKVEQGSFRFPKEQGSFRFPKEQGSVRFPKEQGSFKVPEEQDSISAQEILQLSKKAFEAFKDEEKAAENEQGADMQDDGMTKVSHIFNNRGLFGYLQVANIVFDSLVSLDNNWQKVLTMEISADSFLSIGQKKLFKYKPLIISLRDEVERKCEFFDGYLTYSKPSIEKNEPHYFQTDVKNCYRKYVGTCTPIHSQFAIGIPLQKLKEEMAIAFPGLLSCLDKGYDESNLSRITKLWGEIKKEWEKKKRHDNNKAAQNFILANIILSKVEAASPVLTPLPILRGILEKHLLGNFGNQTPEFYFLVLLLFWPEEHKKMGFNVDLNKCVLEMQESYENTYKKHLRSRYLRPLIFLGKGGGLSRLVHRSKIDNLLARENPMAGRDSIDQKWSSGEVWREHIVQDLLLPVIGVVRQHRVFACLDGKEIEVCTDQRSKVWKSGDVCFYLGFTIRGPVAYGIQYPSRQGHFFYSDMMTGGEPRTVFKVPDIKSIKNGAVRSCTTCANVMESTNWVQVEPVAITKEAPMFSTSPPGRYECRVSGLRWVCKTYVSLKYQFSSWEPHREIMKSLGYKQGGPLLDVTIISGKLEEVHLPHFACFDDDPSFKEKVRVLHVEDCGVFVEQVDEVTRFHVKIVHPSFSPKGVLVRSGFPVKAHCDLLLYQAKTAFLTLHAYLVPCDSSVEQAMKKKEQSYGYRSIRKPQPVKSLRMKDWFSLTTSSPSAEVKPPKMKLRYDNTTPNFFEVFIEDADVDFGMKLISDMEGEIVWDHTIRKADYRHKTTQNSQNLHFVDFHRTDLIQRVCQVKPILDKILAKRVITDEGYSTVMAKRTTQDQMREFYMGPLRASGIRAKNIFYEILKELEPLLIKDLKGE